FQQLLGTGEAFGLNLSYAVQEGEAGIADALARAADQVGDDEVVVILGDNIFQDDLRPYVDAFRAGDAGARLLLRRVSTEDARRSPRCGRGASVPVSRGRHRGRSTSGQSVTPGGWTNPGCAASNSRDRRTVRIHS